MRIQGNKKWECLDRAPEEDETFGYCAEYFSILKIFVAQAAEKDMGLVLYF